MRLLILVLDNYYYIVSNGLVLEAVGFYKIRYFAQKKTLGGYEREKLGIVYRES